MIVCFILVDLDYYLHNTDAWISIMIWLWRYITNRAIFSSRKLLLCKIILFIPINEHIVERNQSIIM